MTFVKAHPVRIEMDDIARHPLLAHAAGHRHHLVTVAISPAADPETEGPIRRHSGRAGELVVAPDQRCHPLTDDQVETQVVSPGRYLPGCRRRLAELVVERCGHVEEDRIPL